MKQSDPLELVDHGSLVRPGPVGRLVRFALGVVCLYALWDIVQYAEIMITQPFSSLDNLVLLIVGPLCVFNYVVNIGFSKSWGNRPLLTSLIVLLLSAGIAFLTSSSFDHPIFGVPLILWLMYFYGHLGIAFLLSAVIATPAAEGKAKSSVAWLPETSSSSDTPGPIPRRRASLHRGANPLVGHRPNRTVPRRPADDRSVPPPLALTAVSGG